MYSSALFSQVQLTGKIINQDNTPMSFVEILLSNRDSVVVKSEFTNEEGTFTIVADKDEYLIKIIQMGKELYTQNIKLDQNKNLGKITVTENNQQLQEVIITTTKKLIERKVDRLIFNVENSISANGGDAIDALKSTPGIRVQNDKIVMISKSTMSVMIDDKLIQLSGNDLINFLKTILSDNIKSIEVITTPPAKYEAEGNSGIVNIKLKKSKKDRISGNLQSAYTQAKYVSNNLGAALNYQKDKVTITANIDYSKSKRAPYQEYTINYPKYNWFETNKITNRQNDLNSRITLDYQITKKTIMGIDILSSTNKPKNNRLNTSFIRNTINKKTDSLIITPSKTISNIKNNTINFHSITKLDTVGKTISFDVDYFDNKSNTDTNFSSNSFYSNNETIPNRLTTANTLNNQKIKIYTSKIDIEMPLKWIKLSFGSKISFIRNNSDVAYYNTIYTPAVLDLTKSNGFNYRENTQALYLSGSKKLGEKWEYQLGIRTEATQTNGFSQTINQNNTNNYLKIYPTLYLTYTKNENSAFSFNYSKRVDRPDYSDLNPFRFYTTSYNYTEGNPFLQPYFTENFELSNTYKNWYTSIFYSYLTNAFDQVTYVSTDNTNQIVKPYNFYKQNTIGLSENYTINKWKWLESTNQFYIYYTKTTSKIMILIPNISSWTASFSSNNSFNLNTKNTIKAEFNFMLQSPAVAGSYKTSSYSEFETGIRFLMLNKRLNLVLNVSDIFKTNKQVFKQAVNDIKQEVYNYDDNQKIRVSLTYNFGKSLEKEKRTQSNEEEKTRIK